MSVEQVIAWVVTILLSLWLGRYLPNILPFLGKSAALTSQVSQLLSEVAAAVADGVLTVAEVEIIKARIRNIGDLLKTIREVREGKILKMQAMYGSESRR